LSMVIPWNGDAMSIPWKFHGNFIWAKTHGKLMDFSFEIFMGYFCKGTLGAEMRKAREPNDRL